MVKVWTAIQHSFGLVGALGVFVLVSAYSTDPNSGMVTFGLVMILGGIIGFVGARAAARRNQH